MDDSSGPKRWFGFYPYGIGYGPVTWQGWIVMAVLVAVIVSAARVLHH